MIQGCLAWQRDGLHPPDAVREATSAYLDAEDSIENWIADCCERDTRSFTAVSQLYGSWKSWAELSGEPPGSDKSFSQNLEGKGFVKARLGKKLGGRGFYGIRLVGNGEN
jgi:putative DNA primase/helicase